MVKSEKFPDFSWKCETETRVVEIVQGEARRVLAQRALNFLSANSQDTAMGLGWFGFGVGLKLRAVSQVWAINIHELR